MVIRPVPYGRGGRRRRARRTSSDARLATIAYVVIGVIVASQHTEYAHLGRFSQVLLVVIATAMWPRGVLGADLHLSLANL